MLDMVLQCLPSLLGTYPTQARYRWSFLTISLSSQLQLQNRVKAKGFLIDLYLTCSRCCRKGRQYSECFPFRPESSDRLFISFVRVQEPDRAKGILHLLSEVSSFLRIMLQLRPSISTILFAILAVIRAFPPHMCFLLPAEKTRRQRKKTAAVPLLLPYFAYLMRTASIRSRTKSSSSVWVISESKSSHFSKILSCMNPSAVSQNPQCEVTNENRIIFGNKRVSKRSTSYPLQPIQDSPDSYLLEAGDAHGITPGAEFSVYPDYDITSHPLGYLVVHKVSSFTSILHRKPIDDPFEIPQFACAVEIRKSNHKSVCVTVVVEDGLKDKLLKYHGHELGGVMLFDEKEEGDLKLVQTNDEVGFEILEKECVNLGMTCTHYRPGCSMTIVSHLLQHTAHFYLHLRRSNQEIKFGK